MGKFVMVQIRIKTVEARWDVTHRAAMPELHGDL